MTVTTMVVSMMENRTKVELHYSNQPCNNTPPKIINKRICTVEFYTSITAKMAVGCAQIILDSFFIYLN